MGVSRIAVIVMEAYSRMAPSTLRPGLARTPTSLHPGPFLHAWKNTCHNDNENTTVHYVTQYCYLVYSIHYACAVSTHSDT